MQGAETVTGVFQVLGSMNTNNREKLKKLLVDTFEVTLIVWLHIALSQSATRFLHLAG